MKHAKAPAGRRVYSEDTSYKMRQMLRMIVLEGTGRKAEAVGYRSAARRHGREGHHGGGYSKRVNVSTFAAAFPMDEPRYVVVVMMDAPRHQRHLRLHHRRLDRGAGRVQGDRTQRADSRNHAERHARCRNNPDDGSSRQAKKH
jgi:cell division protein FtsI/penicillin-binding protein 2